MQRSQRLLSELGQYEKRCEQHEQQEDSLKSSRLDAAGLEGQLFRSDYGLLCRGFQRRHRTKTVDGASASNEPEFRV